MFIVEKLESSLSQIELGYNENPSLEAQFHSPDDMETQRSILKEPVLDRTFLKMKKKKVGLLRFRYRQV